MPWSEWITPAPEPINVIYVRGLSAKKFIAEREDGLKPTIFELRDIMRTGLVEDPEEDTETVLMFNQTLSEYAETSEIGGDKIPPPGYRVIGDISQRDYWVSVAKRFQSIGGIENVRNWFPAEMNDLEYGVDYGPRPDRDEMEDDDAYVEFEPGFDSERVGWNSYVQFAWWGSAPEPESVTAELRLETGWTPPALPLEMPGESPEFWWSETDAVTGLPVSGYSIAGFSGVETDTPDGPVNIGGFLPDQDEFALVLITPVFPDEEIGEFLPGDSWIRQQAVKADVGVNALVQYPRFRYWIPGGRPLRQFPTNHGQKGGAPAARPTSQQGTTARRTYF